jgi:hypothetical protein
MICEPCKNQYHEGCPSQSADDPKKPKTGLTPEGDALQRSGLCGCQHRLPKVVKTEPEDDGLWIVPLIAMSE